MPEITCLTNQDLPEVARIHMSAFPDSALTALGAEAVRRYYEWQLAGPHESTSLGIRISGEMAGFCIGGVFRGAMSGFLRKNRLYLILRVLSRPWLIGNTLFRDRLRSGVRLLGRRTAKPRAQHSAPQARPKSYAILAIAVNPVFQGHGVGRSLMKEAELDALRRGFVRMHLTVSPGNSQAIGFYEGMGWIKSVSDSGWQGEMFKELVPDE